VRELENIIRRFVVLPDGEQVFENLLTGRRQMGPSALRSSFAQHGRLEFDRFPIRPLSISAGTDLLASPRHGLSRADCGEPHTEKV